MPPLPAHNIFLRRLAIPHMPHDNNFYLPAPAPPNTVNPLYNPYITVDYIQNVATKDGRTGMRDPFDMCKAKGKRQPYAGHSSQVIDQTPDSVPGGMIDPWTDMPQHTFFRHNAIEQTSPPNPAAPNQTLQLPFDWLAHLDRQLTSPVELLQVSNFKPYELTQKFIYPDPVNPMGPPVKHGHVLHVDLSGARYPVWFDPTARLYRFFEFLERGGEMAGVSRQGRVPGLVNLNTIWDIEVFRALCDANGASNFTPAQVDAIFAQMLNLRTPDPNRFPAAADRPFRPLSTGNLPLGDPQHPYLPATSSVGINDTLFREDGSGTGARLFQVPGPPSNPQVVHPYQQMELLNKIFNNVTTRSNTFAVWLTVGFFEVTDDTVNPPRLGKEIGKDENKQVRHRFFAVIDRTQLTLFAQGGKTANGAAIPGPGTFEIQVLNPQTGQPTLTGQSPNGTTWNIQAGMTLEVNTGNATEVVVVTGFPMPNPNNSFFATFTKAHPANFPITCRGNMGPWIQPNQPYEVRKDQQVVPFYTVIQ